MPFFFSKKTKSIAGEIDWDSEWQKVVRGEQDSVARPKEVSLELERAQRRVARSTERLVESARSKTRGSNLLRQDANFYLLAIAALGFLPVLVIALTSGGGGDYVAESQYIV